MVNVHECSVSIFKKALMFGAFPPVQVNVFIDGAWENCTANAGSVVFDCATQRSFCGSIEVPQALVERWSSDMGQTIYQIEMWALLSSQWRFEQKRVNRRVIAWIDNEAARAAFVKCTSPSLTLASMCRVHCDMEGRWPTMTWVERVCSYSNPRPPSVAPVS